MNNRIVSCSHDRNAFVWTFNATTDKWEPELVVLRVDRAALSVRWSPDGAKFAVGSGARVVAVCYYEEEHHWWLSKIIRRPRSRWEGEGSRERPAGS